MKSKITLLSLAILLIFSTLFCSNNNKEKQIEFYRNQAQMFADSIAAGLIVADFDLINRTMHDIKANPYVSAFGIYDEEKEMLVSYKINESFDEFGSLEIIEPETEYKFEHFDLIDAIHGKKEIITNEYIRIIKEAKIDSTVYGYILLQAHFTDKFIFPEDEKQ